jgi:hypothetical protein
MKGYQGMLTITVGATEFFNEETGAFELHGGYELQLEHSSGFPFKMGGNSRSSLSGSNEKTAEQLSSYIECMLLTLILRKIGSKGFLKRTTKKFKPTSIGR